MNQLQLDKYILALYRKPLFVFKVGVKEIRVMLLFTNLCHWVCSYIVDVWLTETALSFSHRFQLASLVKEKKRS